MPLVAGVDSSTQSTKIVVCDAASGEVVREASAPHPEGTEVHPDAWWAAFAEASGEGLLDDVAAIAVAGQQHGMVAVDEERCVVRPALLWNDTRSAGAASDLVAELGAEEWAKAVGSVPVASFTVTKLRWLAEAEPKSAARVAEVMLPHDWLTSKLLGGGATTATDRGDASGTGYFSPATGGYRTDLLRLAFGRDVALPRLLAPAEPAGTTPSGMLVAAGTGDNMGAALGLGIEPGDVVVSLGTSGTVFAVCDTPSSDPTGAVAGFADATGRYLPLVCTLNAAGVLTSTARLLDTDLDGLSRLALAAPAGAGGLVLLPYLVGERTPNLPDATGTLVGLRPDTMTPAHLARAAVEGMLCGLADGLDALVAQGVDVRRVLLIGGAARSEAVCRIAPLVFGVPIVVPEPAQYVAVGAARQAAWALTGTPTPPSWPLRDARVEPGDSSAAFVRERYGAVRDSVRAS
jgi:xylulokinase